MESSVVAFQERFSQTVGLYEMGLSMVRRRLAHEHPAASPEEVEELLRAWLLRRPGAEDGDAGPDGFRLRQREP